MPKPRIPAGELGAVRLTKLADGRYRARGRMRDDAGELHQLRATADTEDGALDELREAAALLTSNGEEHNPSIVIRAASLTRAVRLDDGAVLSEALREFLAPP